MLLLTILAAALGVVLDQPCRGEGWANGDNTQFSRGCYSDIVHLYWGRGIADGVTPYVGDPSQTGDEPIEYPVLTGVTMWVLSFPVPDDWQFVDRARLYFDINAIAIALLAAVTVWATAKTSGPRPWDAAMVAIAPGFILTATINWDLWAVALTAAAMLAWARRYPAVAGILLGLGAAYKFYPLLLLGPLLVLCFRARCMRAFGWVLAGTVVTWLAANIPIMVANYEGWSRFYELSQERGADFGSIWLVIDRVFVTLPPDQVNVLGTVAFATLCIGIGLLGLLAPRRPRFAQLAFLTIAAFLITNKVYSPQYVLWLIPLAVLARPRWRDFLWWQAAEVTYFFAVWWYIIAADNPDRGLPDRGYWLAIAVHVLATVAFSALVVRDVLKPEHDPVRSSTGEDDPGGGILNDAREPAKPAAKHKVGVVAAEPGQS